MFLPPNPAPRPMFPRPSRLSVARDVAVLTVCIGIVVGFLIDVWSPPMPRRVVAPTAVAAQYDMTM